MITLNSKIENKTLKEIIDDNPVEVKKEIEQGNYIIDDNARIYLNKQYYNIINLDYKISYNLNTKKYKINSSIMTIEDYHNESDESTNLYELKVVNHIIKRLIKENTQNISSISIKVINKRIYDILTKKQRYFDIYSDEFKLYYNIARLTKHIKLKISYVIMG